MRWRFRQSILLANWDFRGRVHRSVSPTKKFNTSSIHVVKRILFAFRASQGIYDSKNKSWCGAGCGKCYTLTSTGKSACSTCGTGGAKGKSIIVMVTNLCPHNGNAQWCPAVGGKNQYGYSAHFDIMSQGNFIWGEYITNPPSVLHTLID